MRTQGSWKLATAAGVLAVVVAGCGVPDPRRMAENTVGGNESVDHGFAIGLLLPDARPRYEAFDRPYLEKKVQQLCPRCQVLSQNAGQDAAKQRTQAEALLAQGIKVLILDAVDPRAAGAIVSAANKKDVPVIAYDRLAEGPVDYFVSYDSVKIGQVQAQALLQALQAGGDPKRGALVMINGSPTDPNAADFKAGVQSVLDGRVTVGAEYDTPDWSAEHAQSEMEQAVTALGREKIIGVYAANDATASGAIAAMKSGGFTTIPPTTGQDAELPAIQRILVNEQHMTVYKAIRPQAEIAAQMAVDAATGRQFNSQPTTMKYNGTRDVTSVLLAPVAVTRDNIGSTVVADGLYTPAQLCAPPYGPACLAAGIS